MVGDRVLAAERGRDGDAVAESEVAEMVRGSRAPVGAADDRYRRSGLFQQLEQSLDRAGIRRLGHGRNAWTVDRFNLVAQHVLGKRKHDRPGRPAVATRYA